MIPMPPTLEGALARLRALRADDLAFCLDMANDPELRGWLRFVRPMSEAQERAWMAHLHDDEERVWIVEDAETGRRVGVVSLSGWSHVARHAELGVVVVEPQDRSRGYGGEACRLVLRHAFEDMNLQRVHLNVYEDNPAKRLYERLGFRMEGVLRRHTFKRGAFRDVHVMGLLREEWQK